jgi:hypothetical protein
MARMFAAYQNEKSYFCHIKIKSPAKLLDFGTELPLPVLPHLQNH